MSYKILIADENNDAFVYLQNVLKNDSDRFKIIQTTRKNIYNTSIEQNPDIILVNVESLSRNGIESIMSLKQDKLTHGIPVLLITDYSPRTNFDRVFEYGIVDFIKKPYTRDELLMRIEAADSRREFQHDIYIEHELLRELSIVAKKTATGVAILSGNGSIEWVNEGFEKMYGYELNEFKEKFENQIFKADSNPKLANAITKCKEGADSFAYENKWETREGRPIWVQTTLTPVYNEQDIIIKYIAIEANVTALKEAEERLEAKNESLLTLTEHLENSNELLEKQRGEIEEQKEFITEQKKKSDELLLNILPFETAEQLKKKGFAKSKQYKLVSILFTDFKDFSKLPEVMESQELIKELNVYIQKFDEIIEGHYIEKIKTIGDAFMCAGGLPLRNKSNPIDVTLAGLEIQKFMLDYGAEKRQNGEKPWELRLGIHTGEVIAGVIGKKKFTYDIWGDAVNKASRMEQAGEVGKVNVSGNTFEYIKDYFDCTHRGKIEVKNNIQLDMYFVNRLKPEFSEDEHGVIPNAEFRRLLSKY
ncbi:MAG: PAS domain-containing protein [Bacteroidales bacterium]|nr:PAS domain-containing protein [Bacteroidales bacterium]